MKAVFATGDQAVAVADHAGPSASGKAVVRVDRVGLCGTDVKIVHGSIPVTPPRVIGHEVVGHVVTAGPTGVPAEGARVLVDPGVACGRCAVCLADRTHLCPNGALLGRDEDGGATEYLAVAESQLHVLPADVGDDDATLLQVLATCLHAQECVTVQAGQTAAVVGLGVAGMLHLQLLRLRGAGPIVAVTTSAWKRDLAVELGATVAVGPDEAEAAVRDVSGGHGVELAVECAGTPHTLRQSMLLAGPGGEVLVFGTTSPEADAMPTYQWYYKELTIKNPRAARPRDYERSVQLGASGALQLGRMVTATYPLTDAVAALAACHDPKQLKVALTVG
ncbi:MAG: alcohol dehydrogenase catalytic domain-containing protein [Streptosporangiales bacterium]|nr:alcohol dehydrogenase catalytic domain-containing protein [Streptosporangiales bacterium]